VSISVSVLVLVLCVLVLVLCDSSMCVATLGGVVAYPNRGIKDLVTMGRSTLHGVWIRVGLLLDPTRIDFDFEFLLRN
jgi:hypothetical protein